MTHTRRAIRTEHTLSTAGTAGETATWTYNIGEQWDGTSRLIIAIHGHGTPAQDAAASLVFGQNVGPGSGAMALARTGRYIVCSIQANGGVAWSKPSVQTAIANAVGAGRTRGAKTGKYGVLGWSMGGLTAAKRVMDDSANIAAGWLWAPAVDMNYIYTDSGNSTWHSEIDAAFGGTTAAQFASTDPTTNYLSFRGIGTKLKLCHATNDSTVPYASSSNFVGLVNDPNVTLRQPDIVGDHTTLFQYIPDEEIVAHFDSGNWS